MLIIFKNKLNEYLIEIEILKIIKENLLSFIVYIYIYTFFLFRY